MSWTIEAELCKTAGKDSAAEAIEALGLTTSADRPYTVREISAWQRLGAETYLYDFEVTSSAGASVRAVVKACIAPPSEGGLAATMQEWLRRRYLIEGAGPSLTPVLFGATAATVVEEWIPFGFFDRLRSASTSADRMALLRSGGSAAAALGFLEFNPLSLGDMRTRGTDAVLIDFGFDLGPSHVAAGIRTHALDRLLQDCAEHSIGLSRAESSAIDSGFADTLEALTAV